MMKKINISTINCGIKYKNRDDLLLISFDEKVNVAGVFTKSSMPAASINWCKNNIKNGKARALIVNAGNANAFTGKEGEEIVLQTAKSVAKNLNCDESEVFISSTGVIGELFDVNLITDKIPQLLNNPIKGDLAWQKAASAIMTTDLKPKLVKKTCKIGDEKISLIGFAKGSGMIAPNMATMLGYIFTDANIKSEKLSEILKKAADKSFNSITVDSDTSTNDSLFIFASNQAKNHQNDNLDEFINELDNLCLELAKMIIIDGEGAQKLIEIEVCGANNKEESKKTAFAIANSPLVKCAIAGCDPNWGRIVMAVGKSCKNALPENLIIKIGDYQLTKDGAKHPNYIEKEVHEYLKNSSVKIFVDLGIEKSNQNNTATVWTCDFNEEYIKINKDYRS